MKSMLWVHGVVFVLMGALSVGFGLRGLLKGRPLIFSARWFFGFMVLLISPQLLRPLFFGAGHSGGFRAPDLIATLMFAFVLGIFWLQMRGYFVFGVTDATVRSALQHALQKLGLQYEERLSVIHVPSEGLDFQVAVQSWMGTAQMRAKQAEGRARLQDMTAHMEEYFATNSVESSKTPFVMYLVLGVFMLIMVGVMLSLVT